MKAQKARAKEEAMEEGSSSTLFLQLHKLSAATTSEETLGHVLETLWRTRKTGLRPLEKSSIQSLLGLPSIEELDPVLACLRSLIRKCVHENLTADNLLKLFPADLPLDLQGILVLLLQRYQNHWKEDASMDQPQCQRTSIPYPVTVGIPPSLAPFSAAELSSPLWPRQDDATAFFNHSDVGNCTPIITDTNVSHVVPAPLQQDGISPENLGILPRLKSMTWTMEKRNSTAANRVAVISLKLQDYTKSPSGEMEVKFQLTRDTLEAMLRSMTYISEQLESIQAAGPPSSEPLQKKQRQ